MPLSSSLMTDPRRRTDARFETRNRHPVNPRHAEACTRRVPADRDDSTAFEVRATTDGGTAGASTSGGSDAQVLGAHAASSRPGTQAQVRTDASRPTFLRSETVLNCYFGVDGAENHIFSFYSSG